MQGLGTPAQAEIGEITPEPALKLDLPAGSMQPKVAAAARFAAGGGMAGIGRLDCAVAILDGKAGTRAVSKQSLNTKE